MRDIRSVPESAVEPAEAGNGNRDAEGFAPVEGLAFAEGAAPAEAASEGPEEGLDLNDPSLLVNREISQLRFFDRVLEEAEDDSVPLLERIKFLRILGSIMAEFFMVRVAGLKQQAAAGVSEPSPDGMTPTEQLVAIRPMVTSLMERSRVCFRKVLAGLDAAGLHIVDYAALTEEQKERIQAGRCV